MTKIAYISKDFRQDSLELITLANTIVEDYERQGFDLTLRQLYYQMVSRAIIPNTERSYKNLGNLIADARLAGLLSWDAIEDRTRNLRELSHWSNPRSIVNAAVHSYRIDKWATQPYRPEVWVEKDALIGVVARISDELDVPYFSCRGYTSASEMWRAGRRMMDHIDNVQIPVVIHLGDHDPSGIDMTRDIRDRLEMFAEGEVEVNRIALNRDQIDIYNPPPNPAKLSDSRSNGYVSEHGYESWELDALEPTVLSNLIRDTVFSYRDVNRWQEMVDREDHERNQLRQAARNIDVS